MATGSIVTLRCGRLYGKRAEVLKVEGRVLTVKGSFGTVQVMASEVKS